MKVYWHPTAESSAHLPSCGTELEESRTPITTLPATSRASIKRSMPTDSKLIHAIMELRMAILAPVRQWSSFAELLTMPDCFVARFSVFLGCLFPRILAAAMQYDRVLFVPAGRALPKRGAPLLWRSAVPYASP
ncbi:hypothetical protein PG994_005094 [Apiospora phragmitis]|uniref:Uncharacterized protein n=1 Tax=Apiospora phragmitis TaxID=2905665 RepID=A0ABR1VVI2_9PEZI